MTLKTDTTTDHQLVQVSDSDLYVATCSSSEGLV